MKAAFPPAPSGGCCQLAGKTERCYCRDRDHAGPPACPCRKVPWGHLSDTRPATGAGAKGSPPGAVWLGRPALNCRVQSCSWSEAISSEALGRVYIPGMSIPFLGSTQQRREQRNNIWTRVTCDRQCPPVDGRNIQLPGLCSTLQDRAAGAINAPWCLSRCLPRGSGATHFGNGGRQGSGDWLGAEGTRRHFLMGQMWWPQAGSLSSTVCPCHLPALLAGLGRDFCFISVGISGGSVGHSRCAAPLGCPTCPPR